MKEEEEEFLKVLEARAAENNGKIEIVDIYKKKSEVEVKELITLSKMVEKVKETFPGESFVLFYKIPWLRADNPPRDVRRCKIKH